MNSRERVVRTLEFKNPDRIPVDLWILPATRLKFGKDFEEILERYERDIVSVNGPGDISFNPQIYEIGIYTDSWGTTWTNLQAGMIGEVKAPIFKDSKIINNYDSPIEIFKSSWGKYKPELINRIRNERKKGKFVIGGWINIFERMQFLRGTEDLYCDLAEQNDDFSKIMSIVLSFYKKYLEAWLDTDVDAIAFGDDWGSQRGLLISPLTWRKFFKPVYKELFDTIKAKKKYIFFHSDGNIMELYPDFIEMGVDAINSQLWCMGVENVAKKFAGEITFWGEISRQDTLPNGTPEDIKKAAAIMKENLFVNGGGLIGQSETGKDMPLENIKAILTSWN